jgi:hypothetical protein
MDPNLVYKLAELAAVLALLLAFFGKTLIVSRCFFVVQLALGFYYLFLRYWLAFPMQPMFMGTAGVPPVLGFFGALYYRRLLAKEGLFLYRSLLGLIILVGLVHVLFPKDFYLPFLKTATFFSQCHLLFTVLGKAALFLSGLFALDFLFAKKTGSKAAPGLFFLWLIIGFSFWTLSMFTGEVWSYLGWGLPVVWDDAVIVTFMATWFFYIALLHLHLAGNFSARPRAWFSAFGLVWLFVINCLPDMGPFRFPAFG